MRKEAERAGSYQLGLNTTSIEHRDPLKVKDHFELIGHLPFKELCRNSGQVGFTSKFEEFARDFDDLDNYARIFKCERFKITDLLEGT